MEMVRFGKTGMQVSRICLGCMTYGSTKWREWVLEEEASRPFIREALERGVNFFDTADVYSQGASEEILGRALKDFARRSEVVIATKVHGAMGPGANAKGLSRKHIMEGIDASLKRLGTDYVDLYQIHRFDPATPMEETMEALNDVVRAGKALYIGASSMYAWQFARMIDIARSKGHAEFASMQNYYNLVYREEEREMMKFCAFDGIAVIPWSPMARGYLAGSGLGENASTVRGRTDPFSVTLGLGIAPGRGDPQARRRDGREARNEARGGGARLGAVEALRDIPDHRRLEAAPPRRRGRRDRAQARRPHNRQTRGALSAQAGRRACVTSLLPHSPSRDGRSCERPMAGEGGRRSRPDEGSAPSGAALVAPDPSPPTPLPQGERGVKEQP